MLLKVSMESFYFLFSRELVDYQPVCIVAKF